MLCRKRGPRLLSGVSTVSVSPRHNINIVLREGAAATLLDWHGVFFTEVVHGFSVAGRAVVAILNW